MRFSLKRDSRATPQQRSGTSRHERPRAVNRRSPPATVLSNALTQRQLSRASGGSLLPHPLTRPDLGLGCRNNQKNQPSTLVHDGRSGGSVPEWAERGAPGAGGALHRDGGSVHAPAVAPADDEARGGGRTPRISGRPLPTTPECTDTHAHSPRRTLTLPTPGVTAPPHFRGGRRHRGCGGALDPGCDTAPATISEPDLIPLQKVRFDERCDQPPAPSVCQTTGPGPSQWALLPRAARSL